MVMIKCPQENSTKYETSDFSISRKSKMTLLNIHCTKCGVSFNAIGQEVCPKCGTPVLMLGKLIKKAKNILQVGESYKMGRYGGEKISWRVLAVANGKALLISEKGLDAKAYNAKKESVTWETCTLRKWLNNDFYTNAFGTAEREKIVTVKVTADKNPKYATDPGNDTEDKIFLLSIQEAEKYFSENAARMAFPTEYAKMNKAHVDEESSTKSCWWWLRSPGKSGFGAAGVSYKGWINHDGHRVQSDGSCIRPALWIRL